MAKTQNFVTKCAPDVDGQNNLSVKNARFALHIEGDRSLNNSRFNFKSNNFFGGSGQFPPQNVDQLMDIYRKDDAVSESFKI